MRLLAYITSSLPLAGARVALLAAVVIPTATQAQTWGQYGVTVRQILDPSFVPGVYGGSINNAGMVAGRLNNVTGIYSVTSGTIVNLGTLGGTSGIAQAINNAGQVAGSSTIAGTSQTRALFNDGVSNRNLGTLGGTYSTANGINDAGQVAGFSLISGNGAYHAFRTTGATMQDLGTLGGTSSFAYGINSAGRVVGQSEIAGNAVAHAFVVNGGSMQDLGTLAGGSSTAFGINDSGLIVGYSSIGSGIHAFVSDGTTMVDLGSFGGTMSQALGISNDGYITGIATDASGSQKAALWEKAGGTYVGYDVNAILKTATGTGGWTLDRVMGISDNGSYMVVEGGNTTTGAWGYYVLEANAASVVATPEPASILLLGTGLIGAAAFTRRRKQR